VMTDQHDVVELLPFHLLDGHREFACEIDRGAQKMARASASPVRVRREHLVHAHGEQP